MARRYEDAYEREVRDRRGRDNREMQREQDSRDRIDPREQRRIDVRDSDRMEYTRDGHPDLRTTRDPAARTMYSYADEMDRDDQPSRGYMDDPRDRHRPPPIDLQTGRREDPSSRYQEYFLPREDINRELIQYDICRYLGNDATVRPYMHSDGRQGYLIRAYRALTTAMIATLKADSKRFENERAQTRRQGMSFGASITFDDRERQGRPDVPQSGYTGYGMDTTMDDYDDDRGTNRGYRNQDPRPDPRMDPRQDLRQDPRQDTRQDPRQDPRQQLPINRHGQMPPVSQGYSQDPPYTTSYQVQAVSSGYYEQAGIQPRTMGPNNTPPPPLGREGQAIYPGGYPVTTLPGYPISTSTAPPSTVRYADTANGRSMVGYPPGVTYAPDRHASARR